MFADRETHTGTESKRRGDGARYDASSAHYTRRYVALSSSPFPLLQFPISKTSDFHYDLTPNSKNPTFPKKFPPFSVHLYRVNNTRTDRFKTQWRPSVPCLSRQSAKLPATENLMSHRLVTWLPISKDSVSVQAFYISP